MPTASNNLHGGGGAIPTTRLSLELLKIYRSTDSQRRLNVITWQPAPIRRIVTSFSQQHPIFILQTTGTDGKETHFFRSID